MINIIGIELDVGIYNEIKDKYDNIIGDTLQLINIDFLKYKSDKQFDLILGNPPFFMIQLDKEEKKLYKEILNGKVNIYCLFIYKCIKEHLKDGGILAFILPTSIMNSTSYKNLRKYINDNTTILKIIRK